MTMKLPFVIDLSDKVAIVTGAGGVICSYLASVMASCGAKVALLDINEEAAKIAAEEINDNGGMAIGLKCDVLDRCSLQMAHKEIMKIFGKCSILLNGAGGNHPTATTTSETFKRDHATVENTFFNLDKEGIQFVFDLNFMGTFLSTQEFSQDMIDGGEPAIINISSMNAFTPLTKIPAYSAAKASVSNFTQWLAVYFAEVGIRVNAIAPGFLSTKQTKALFYEEDGVTPTSRLHKIIAGTPQGRLGEPEDLAGTLLWLLCSEASGFVTGAVIPVDGGYSSYSGV